VVKAVGPVGERVRGGQAACAERPADGQASAVVPGGLLRKQQKPEEEKTKVEWEKGGKVTS